MVGTPIVTTNQPILIDLDKENVMLSTKENLMVLAGLVLIVMSLIIIYLVFKVLYNKYKRNHSPDNSSDNVDILQYTRIPYRFTYKYVLENPEQLLHDYGKQCTYEFILTIFNDIQLDWVKMRKDVSNSQYTYILSEKHTTANILIGFTSTLSDLTLSADQIVSYVMSDSVLESIDKHNAMLDAVKLTEVLRNKYLIAVNS